MALLRTLVSFLSVGAVLGMLAASYIGARFLPWYNAPAQGQALCDCADITRKTSQAVLYYQLVGAGVGAGLGIAGGITFAVMRRKKAKETAPPPVAPAPKV